MSNIIALIMAVLIIMLFGVFYHIAVENTYKKLELVNKELEVANYQKEILLNETHHRVKNNLQMISNMIGLQKKATNDDKTIEILERTRSRIHSISMIHDILYKHESFEKIQFDKYIEKLTSTIQQMHDKKVDIKLSKEPIYLNTADILILGIITNELLINSFKYAFDDIKGKVEIALFKKEDHLLYTYKDNGQREVKLQSEDSLGFKIIKMMVEQMEADLSLWTKKGLGFEMKIPLND